MSRVDLLQLRRGAAAVWTAVDPVLAVGEPGLETDTNKIKVGDGTSAWSDLPYFGGSGGFHEYVFEGQATGPVTSIPLQHGVIMLSSIGVPVASSMRTGPVAVAIVGAGTPLGIQYTLTLEVKPPGSPSFADAATFIVNA